MRYGWLTPLAVAACALPPPAEPSAEAGDPAAPVLEAIQGPERPDPWRTIGETVQGRPIREARAGVGPRSVLWVGGIHGDERESAIATAELLDAFMEAGDLQSKVTLTIVEDINPDGTAANTRRNARGVDLNRNFPASNVRPSQTPLSEPESQVLHDLILRVQPDLVIVAHSWRGRQFINFDGPARELARLFSTIAPEYPMQSSRGLSPTPGSLGSWVGLDMKRPILTLEHRRGKDPERAWRDTREAILAVIRG